MYARKPFGWLLFIIAVMAVGISISTSRRKETHMRTPPESIWSDARMIAIAHAIDQNDLRTIDKLVQEGVNLNLKGKQDETILVYAVGAQNKKAFEHLLEIGADPNVHIDELGNMVYFTAKSPIDSEWLEIVLKYGGDPNVACVDGDTPLFGATNSHRISNLEILLKAGADINHQNNAGETPVVYAAGFNFYDSVYYLLQAGSDYRLKDKYGNDLASRIIKSSVDRNGDAGKLREKVIQFLTDKGFDFREAEERIAQHDMQTSLEWEQEKKVRQAKTAPPSHSE
jgi:ankyrin repeat protein